MTRKRMQALRFSNDDDRRRCRQLVELHLRFHGYGDGEWTDSAVRRYVRDAGDHARPAAQADPRRLHDAQQAQGRPARRAPTTTSRSASRGCPRRRSSPRSARRSTATGSWRCSASRRAARSARPTGFLLELRLDRGPMTEDEAEAVLRAWWAAAAPPDAGADVGRRGPSSWGAPLARRPGPGRGPGRSDPRTWPPPSPPPARPSARAPARRGADEGAASAPARSPTPPAGTAADRPAPRRPRRPGILGALWADPRTRPRPSAEPTLSGASPRDARRSRTAPGWPPSARHPHGRAIA